LYEIIKIKQAVFSKPGHTTHILNELHKYYWKLKPDVYLNEHLLCRYSDMCQKNMNKKA